MFTKNSSMMQRRDSEWSIRKKLIFMVLLLMVYRVGVAIPVPFVNPQFISDSLASMRGEGLLLAMSMVGGSFTRLGLLSLGVMPYITASIIMQLMKVVIPKVEEAYRSDSGQKKITQWTRYLALLLAAIQSVSVVLGMPLLMGGQVFTTNSATAKIIAIFSLTIGAMITMRLGEIITQKGIGNGTSLIIFTSILVGLPSLITNSSMSVGWFAAVGFVLVLAVLLAFIVYIEKTEYRVKVIYTKNSRNNRVQSNHLPIKVSIAGVLPVIFASTMVAVPQIIATIFQNETTAKINNLFMYGAPLYTATFLLLTVFFTFFSLILVFDTKKLSANLTSSGGFIAGKRPGEETKQYLDRKSRQLSVFGAIYLVIISVVSIYVFPIVGVRAGGFTATSVIILCTVIVTLITAIQSEKSKQNTGKISIFNN